MDGSLRTLERALAAGDDQVRLHLATAYQRLGRAPEALSVLAPLAAEPEAVALSELLWREELSALRPAARVKGQRAYGELWGWAGAHPVLLESALERTAPQAARLLGVVDLGRERFVWELPPRLPRPGRPVGAGEGELLLAGDRPGTLLRHRLHEDPGAAETLTVDDEGQVVAVEGEWALLSVSWPGGRELRAVRLGGGLQSGARGRVARGGRRLQWTLDERGARLVWLNEEQLWTGDLAGREEARPLARARLQPATRLEAALQGEALLAEPLQAVPLDGGEPRMLAPLRGHGPWRRSRDGRYFLGYRLGLPLAVASQGVATRSPTLAPPRGLSRAFWHPHAALVALGRADEGTELRDLEGAVVTQLPRDAVPLGWRPDGRGLLVVRRLGPVSGLLELWTPGGTP
ncbi:MAG: hypothetical protein AB7N76_03625 [Planctomycetota bacterium]